MTDTIHDDTLLAHHLKSLLLLRWLLLLLLIAGLALAHEQLHLVLEYTVLLSLLLGFAALNLLTHWRLWRGPRVRHWELVAQLLVDFLGISLLLYFAGGATNPFVSYLLIPLCIAAVALPASAVISLTAIAIGCYALLLTSYVPAEAMAPGHHHGPDPSLHTWGMGINFFISACLVAAFLSRMAGQLRKQADLLRAQREQVLHAEQITGIATLAAGTAHELGTPLGTMKIAASELASADLPHGLNAEADEILKQLGHCQSLLIRLREKAQQSLDEKQSHTPVDLWLQKLTDEWRLLNPRHQLDFKPTDTHLDSYCLSADPTLQQSLHNLLNNAATHSHADIALDAYCEGPWLILCIHDSGKGAPESVLRNWGKPFNSGSDQGMGLGIYLSNATLERHGGELRLEPNDKGNCTWVRIPVQTINSLCGN
ncbi:ATP-binding protein [Simiduia agarivorans]|uniref:histidine kinase n=1 Tax=Simiduia agarivorans (strain DSM 21679 / JCM 13881 / BCRC 17597 / SA1) TaxID=1117647 RepID=K4KLG3_SIMAS|nr:ATP-binding protein [Simiduia agarivorans]AFU98903.1 periplasmic sensor signal transduction histidine kinase [Simiduia agarivorans SA1 = DSM 21679]